MNPSLIEELLRILVAVTATVATILLWMALRRGRVQWMRPLLVYLTVVVAMNAAWRWVLAVFGATWSSPIWIEFIPFVQPLNAVFLWLLFVAIALVAWAHSRWPR